MRSSPLFSIFLVVFLALPCVWGADNSLRTVAGDEEYQWFQMEDMTGSWSNRYEELDYEELSEFDFGEEEDLLLRDLLEEAFRLMKEGYFDESLEKFRDAFERDPKSLRVRFGLGTLYVQTGKLSKAIEMFEWLIEQTPMDYRVHNNLSWLYSTSREKKLLDPDKAVYHAQLAVMQAFQNYNVWSTLAEAYFSAGAYDKAERAAKIAFSIAMEQNAPDLVRVLYSEQLERCRRAARAFTVLH